MGSLLQTYPLHLLLGSEDVSWLVANGLTFSNVDPGGFETASFSIPRNMPGTLVGQKVRLDTGTGVAWEGRVSEIQRSLGNSTNVTCEGWGAKLKEASLSMIYVDRDLTRWGAPSYARQAFLLGKNLSQGSFQVAADSSGNPALIQTISEAWASPNYPTVEAWYDAGAENLIASVYYSMLLAGTQPGSWNIDVVVDADNDSGNTSYLGTANLASGAAGYFTPASQWRFALVQFSGAGTPGGLSGASEACSWEKLAVYGPHGLTLRGTDPGGFYTSDIARHAISQVAGMTAGIIPDISGYIVPHYALYQPVTVEQIVADMAKFAGCHWGTWENLNGIVGNGTPRVDFRPYPNSATVFCQREDCDTLDIREQLATLYDTAQVSFTDAAGISQAVNVTLDNPYLDRVGLHRTVVLNAGTMTLAAAQAFGSMVLGLMQRQARAAGTAKFSHPVKTLGGAPKPAYLLRAGLDRLRVGDLPGSDAFGTRNDFSVSRVECSVGQEGITTSVELGTGANLIEVLQARLQEATQLVGI